MRLIATGIEVRFPTKPEPVLDGADFECATGETVAILGPSGSGKSTLLSVLGGLLKPQAGEVAVTDDLGEPVLVPLSSVSSWILQTTNVLPERSAVDNVAIAAQLVGASRTSGLQQARDALSLVGLDDRAEVRTGLLSGGEVQRVVTARALVAGRPFIFADEPTGQLDRKSTEVVLDALFASVNHDVSEHRKGLVVVTHDPIVAEHCDRIVHIDNGRVVTDDARMAVPA